MSLTDLCRTDQMTMLQRLVPIGCGACEEPAVCNALDALSCDASDEAARQALCSALADTAAGSAIAALLADSPVPLGAALSDTLGSCIDREILGYLYVCRQCTAQELLTVLHACTTPPTPEALALLAGEHRQRRARELYGLQLLWRLLGDEHLPDPMTLFRENPPAVPNAAGIQARLLRQITAMEGGMHHA